MREADLPVDQRVSVLDRSAADGDLPPELAGLIGDRVDRSSVRLALVDEDRRVFIGRGTDELLVVFVDPHGGGASVGPRSTLAERGAIVMWNSNRHRFVVTGVVADPVSAVRVGDVPAVLSDNAFVAVTPRSASEVVVVSTPDGDREVPLPPLIL